VSYVIYGIEEEGVIVYIVYSMHTCCAESVFFSLFVLWGRCIGCIGCMYVC
jgi:uncharacterized protein (UPF0218 family)